MDWRNRNREIALLKDENDRKVNVLVKVNLKELKDLRKETEEQKEIVKDESDISHKKYVQEKRRISLRINVIPAVCLEKISIVRKT